MLGYEQMSVRSIWYTYISSVLAWRWFNFRDRLSTFTLLDKYKGTTRTMRQTQSYISLPANFCCQSFCKLELYSFVRVLAHVFYVLIRTDCRFKKKNVLLLETSTLQIWCVCQSLVNLYQAWVVVFSVLGVHFNQLSSCVNF